MGVKLEYNPSTGKVHFTAATGKVQVVVDEVALPCDDCVVTPIQLRLTFTGVTSLDGCHFCSTDFSPKDRKFENIPDVNNVYILEQQTDCTWGYSEILGTSAIASRYASVDGTCTSLSSSASQDTMTITVEKTDLNKATVAIILFNVASQFRVNSFTSPSFYVPTIGCVGIEDLDNGNQDPDCMGGYGGTVTIEEI